MSKRTYRAVSVNDVTAAFALLEKEVHRDELVIVAVDVAKTDNKAAIGSWLPERCARSICLFRGGP